MMSSAALQLPPVSLYVHIPWCVKKCPYCDFNSHTAETALPEQRYVATLIEDLTADRRLLQGRLLQSVFFGGGTPSLFSAGAIGQILDAAKNLCGIADGAEITLEANPGTFERDKFAGYRSAGVNRISIGVQSFNDIHLQKLGRIHNAGEATTAIAEIKQAGFDNFNIDLMHGLPGQSPAEALDDLNHAIGLAPTHISWYQLTIEPNTYFYNYPPSLPEEGVLDEIQQQGMALLQQQGYRQYEVSAFSQHGRESLHNLNYWQFGDYLGIGAGAHGKVTDITGWQILRYQKTRNPRNYLDKTAGALNMTKISQGQLPQEFMMNGLRLKQGVETALFPARTGLPFETVSETWDALVKKGLVKAPGERLAATEMGYRFLDSVLNHF